MKSLIFLFAVGLAKSTREVLDEDFENLVKQVQLLEATVEGLEDQNASTIKQIADLESAVEDHEEEIQELKGQVKALEDEVEDLNEKVSRLETNVFGPMKAPASCQEYFDNLVRDDGVYLIQPSLDYDPFNVTCTFNETSGIATTVLFHTHEKQFQYTSLPGSSDGCADPGCFRDKISYDANFKQLQALIDISDNCYQTILHNCTSNALTSFSWWVDRFGNNVTYWHGDKETEAEGCECSEDDSCDTGHGGGSDNLCNCDDRDNMNIDYGVLTSRDQLPVMELAYGDSQYRYSWIHYTLGDFTCEGKRWIYPSEIHDNDFAVKVGWTKGPSCNYDYLTTSCSKIDFNQLIYDRSLGSWDINTFTAPVDGFYKFNLHLNYNKNSHASYKLRLYRITEDGTTIADRHGENYYYYQTGTGYPNTQNFISDIYLKKGEQAYYNTEYTAASNHNLNGWTDCETIPGDKHSCTWLEIRKSGEMTVKEPEF